MRRASWLVLVALAACGGKLAPVDDDLSPIVTTPQPSPTTTSTPPSPPTAYPRPTSSPPIPPPPPDDAGVPPPSPPPPPLNTRTWPCKAGEQVEMEYIIDASSMSDGRVGTCRSLVAFEDDLDDVQHGPDFDYNGISVCRSWEPRLTGRTHCGTLKYGSGRSETQFCTVFALCENGQARAIGFSR